MKSSPDITVKVALFEDSAAVVGLILAALGVGLGQLTGSPIWDGAASIAIGVLLVAVAIKLGMDSRELLIGRAADSEVQQLIREEIGSQPGVDALLELRTMHMGPDSLIVAARVALNDEMGADQAEDLADDRGGPVTRPGCGRDPGCALSWRWPGGDGMTSATKNTVKVAPRWTRASYVAGDAQPATTLECRGSGAGRLVVSDDLAAVAADAYVARSPS